MINKYKSCARCGKVAPNKTIKYYRGVALGPECKYVIEIREFIRSSGPNRRVLRSSQPGQFHAISDYTSECPEDTEHCLECHHLKDLECPCETKYRHQFANLSEQVKKKK